MDEVCESVARSILDGKTPSFWTERSYPCLKALTEFVSDFAERFRFWKVKAIESLQCTL